MKKIWLLIKIQLKGSLNPKKMFNMKETKNTSKIALLFLAALVAVLFGGMSGFYAYAYASALKPLGGLYIIPAMWMAITSVITLFTTIFKVKGTLFQFRDYDMVMSMPVPTYGIVASRISVLYLYDLLFCFIIMLPGNIVYAINAKEDVSFYVISTLLMLFIPMIPILIGTLIGLIITIASTRFRYSNFLTLGLCIVLFVAYFIVIFKSTSGNNSEQELLNIRKALMDQVAGIYPLVTMYVAAVTKNNFVKILEYVGISLSIFIVFCAVIGMNFRKINTLIASSKAKSNYKMKSLKTNSMLGAIYKKEIKRYFASPMYVLNSAIGIIMMTIATIALLVAGKEKMMEILQIPMEAEQFATFVPVILLICGCMTCTTSSSISLEGKTLWLYQSLPIPPKTIFMGKILLNLTMTVPFILIDGIVFGVILKMKILDLVLAIVLAIIGSLFISAFGLFVNLKFPRFDWKSEMEVVKNSIPTFICMFGGMILGIAPFVMKLLLKELDFNYILLAFSLILSIITIVIYKYLTTKGSTAFSRL